MNNSIIKRIGDCEVTMEFGNKLESVKDSIIWLIIESFKERIGTQAIISISSQCEGIGLIG